jgi:hypothetical protein
MFNNILIPLCVSFFQTPSVPLIRLVVLQRRAKFVLGGGVSSFAMEPIGVPVLDVSNSGAAFK